MTKPKVLMVSEIMKIPFGHVSLVSSLRQNGIDADYFLAATLNQDRLAERVRREQPNVIGFSVYDYTAPGMDIFFETLRQASPESFIAIGGPLPTADLAGAVNVTTADFAISGPGEESFPMAVHALSSTRKGRRTSKRLKLALKKVPGFYGVFKGDRIRSSRRPERLGNLDDLPIDLSLLEQDDDVNAFAMITARGCGYRTCNFCTAHDFGEPWNGMSAERIIELLHELKGLIESGAVHPGNRTIKFQDNDFIYDRERFFAFAGQVKRTGLDSFFNFESAQASIDSLFVGHDPKNEVDAELIAEFKSVFGLIGIGTDGFTDKELGRLNKARYTIQDVERVAKAVNNAGLAQLHYVILTNPETTIEDVMETSYNLLRFSRDYQPFAMDANTNTQAFVGTRVHEKALPSLREGRNQFFALRHSLMSPYFHIVERMLHPADLRSFRGYMDYMEGREGRYPVLLPGVDPAGPHCKAFLEALGDYASRKKDIKIDASVIKSTMVKFAAALPRNDDPKARKSIELAKGYIKKLYGCNPDEVKQQN